MSDLDEIPFTVKTFQKVLASEKARLAIGVKLRSYIHEEIEAGREPDHYRMEWLHLGIRHIITELEKIGRAFNAANPTDKFSTADMIDIVHSATLTLRHHVEQDDEDDEVAGSS